MKASIGFETSARDTAISALMSGFTMGANDHQSEPSTTGSSIVNPSGQFAPALIQSVIAATSVASSGSPDLGIVGFWPPCEIST